MANYDAKKVTELRTLCKDRGLLDTGKKAELVERLAADDRAGSAAKRGSGNATTTSAPPRATAPGSPPPRISITTTGGPATAATVPSLKENDPHVTTQSVLQSHQEAIVPKRRGAVGDITHLSDAERTKLRSFRFCDSEGEDQTVKKMARAERFGLANETLDDQRRRARAERFGVQHEGLDEDRKKAREERFGSVHSEDEKRKAREARFVPGSKLDAALQPEKRKGAPPGAETDEEAAKRFKRADRFGVMSEDDKKKLRAQRFE